MNQVWTVAAPGLTPITFAPTGTNATTFSFAGVLNGAAQVPANSSTATGFFIAILAGTPDEWSFHYEVAVAGLTGGLALAHIHLGDRNITDAVLHQLNNTAPLVAAGANTGTMAGKWRSAELPATVLAADIFNYLVAGCCYISVHSTGKFLQAGEICGPIEPTASQPKTLLGLVTAGALGVAARRENCKHASKRRSHAYYV